ncbi:B3GALT1 [Lepeophtheirus salmonis]|uniref:Hexosyltransferase n=1 Tax=Lepeophtheirus salmonis TaxID=72036 RepID=A0A7R8CSJ6_LEPSM|nr:B3GALT1 [Lepeophtheirus salmonis]CAF2865558.1 B3GALT1 [Lepeophtheirus salmonis]
MIVECSLLPNKNNTFHLLSVKASSIIIINTLDDSTNNALEQFETQKISHHLKETAPFSSISFGSRTALLSHFNCEGSYRLESFDTRILARGEEVDVLGVIHSSPNHFENLVFLLGTKEMDSHSKSLLSSEIDSFGDIVVEDFMDTYNNLTLKSIFMLKFIVRYNLKIKTLFKMDDDSYFNVERFPTIIDFDSTAIRGFKYVQTYPIRYATIFTVASKWICPSWMYVDDIYPEYIGGAGYLIPGSEIPKLYKSSFTTLFIHLEDVFLTGIIAKLNSVPRENIPSFLDKTGSTCPKDITMLLFHPINPSKMKVIHQLIKEGDNTHCQWH